MAGKSVALDIGGHSCKAIAVRVGRHGVQVTGFAAVPIDEGPEALRQVGLSLKGVVCGLSGRDMNLRYNQVPPTPDWQLKSLMDLEIQDLAQQSGGALSADYNLLPSADPESGVDTVLLALARDEALERLTAQAVAAGGSVEAFTPNCIALYNAFLKCGPVEDDAVVCVANLGHETIDLAIVRGQDLLFARNLSGGGKVLDDAIAAAFNVSARKAETLKRDLLDLDPQSRGRFASGQAEKVTMAAGGAAGAIVAAIQSSLAFCKAQTKVQDLKLDKILVSGGGARIRGVRGMLREALRCPVELFDPFGSVDLSTLPAGDAEQLQAMRYEAVVALGLAVGRVDDSLYSLEILPAAVRKRRQFAQRTVWNIVAAVLAVGVLVLYARHRQEAVANADLVRSRVVRTSNSVKSIHDEAAQIVDANKEQRAFVAYLGEQALPLNATLRSLRATTRSLPPQLWLKTFVVQQRNQGPDKKLVVEIKGSGKEIDGSDVGTAHQRFAEDMHKEPLLLDAGAKSQLTPATQARDDFTFTIDFGGGS